MHCTASVRSGKKRWVAGTPQRFSCLAGFQCYQESQVGDVGSFQFDIFHFGSPYFQLYI